MKRFLRARRLFLAALFVGIGLGVGALVQAGAPYSRSSPWGLFTSGGSNSGSPITISGAGTTDCVLYNDNGAQGCTRGADEAPNSVVMSGQSAWPGSATNKTGADVALAAGDGSTTVTITTVGNCGTDTVTVTRTMPSGTTYASTATVLTENTDWLKGATNATACAALATAIDALTGVSAACSSATVLVTRDATTRSMSLAISDPTCGTVANGTDGSVNVHGLMQLVSPGKLQYPSGTIVDLSGTNGYLSVTTAAGAGGTMRFASNDITLSPSGAATFDLSASDLVLAAALNLIWSGRGIISAPATNILRASGGASLTTAVGFQLYPQSAAVPAEPAACNSTNFGTVHVVDDSNDTAATQVCFCGKTNDDTTFDWLKLNDPTAACPFF